MNWKTENKKSFNFYTKSTDSYRNNFDAVTNVVEEPKTFRIAQCKRCHIKVSTSNDKCPCCEEPVE